MMYNEVFTLKNTWSNYFNSFDDQQQYQQTKLGVEYPINQICVDCVIYHTLDKGLDFNVNCKPLEQDYFDEPQDKSQPQKLLKIADNPYFFAKEILGIEPRQFQKEFLSCRQQRKVLRVSRRSGKSHAMAIYQLWFATTHQNQQIRIVAPRDIHVKELFDKMDQMIRNSQLLRDSIVKISTRGLNVYRKNPYEIQLKNGSVIRGLTTGDSDGTSVRSQTADLLIMDEQDYVSDTAIAAVFPLIQSNSKTQFVLSSTPYVGKSYFFQWCHDQSYKELYYSYQELDTYDPETDKEFQRTLTKEQYEREILALFSMQESGVFPNKLIDQQLEDYEFDNLSHIPQGTYTMGIDWNEQAAGVQIIVVRWEPHNQKFRVSNVVQINPSEFTQLVAIDTIIELYHQYNPVKIMVDEGFGNTQIQQLRRYGVEYNDQKFLLQLTPVFFGQTVDQYDPITRDMQQVHLKQLLVQITSRFLESGSLILPKQLDTKPQLVGQMRNYVFTGISDSGQPKYSKGNVHQLEALMLQLYGMWMIKDSMTQNYTQAPKEIGSYIGKMSSISKVENMYGRMRNGGTSQNRLLETLYRRNRNI